MHSWNNRERTPQCVISSERKHFTDQNVGHLLLFLVSGFPSPVSSVFLFFISISKSKSCSFYLWYLIYLFFGMCCTDIGRFVNSVKHISVITARIVFNSNIHYVVRLGLSVWYKYDIFYEPPHHWRLIHYGLNKYFHKIDMKPPAFWSYWMYICEYNIYNINILSFL